VLGGTVGLLSGWVADLAGRVRLLERRLDAARSTVAARDAEPPPRERAAEPAPVSATARAAADERVPETAPAIAEPARPAPPRATPVAAAAPRARSVAQQTPSAAEALLAKAGRWFTTGNVPVKVGVVLSLFGVGFLVKEGIDRQVLVLPIELKLSLVALFGIVLLIVGWRLRTRQRVYALSVQGGGIGVLYLTIYASFDFYQLLPAALAFGLLVAVTAATGVLAVLQDARSLAVLGTFGGFLAPVLASTGSGNHVALFGYYAVLDLAILGIAWFKAWRVLNVLGFLFTFGIGTLWGIDGYRPEHFATTEPFLVLFTLIYLVVPVLFASRAEPRLRGFVDGTLLFGTPVVAFALQSQLVAGIEYGLAISAVVLALVYVGMATYLYRVQRETLRVLVEAQLALGVAFVTVAVPLALDARWTSAAWALQGAALVWLAFRQQRTLALLAGLVLQALSAVAYVEQPWGVAAWPVVNGYTLGALMLALAGFFSARAVDPARAARAPHPSLPDWLAKALSIVLRAWAAGCGSSAASPKSFAASAPTRSSRPCSASSRPRRCSPCSSRRASRGRGSTGSARQRGPSRHSSASSPRLRSRTRARASAGSRGRPSSLRCSIACARARRSSAGSPGRCTSRPIGWSWASSCRKRAGSSSAWRTASGPRRPCSRLPRCSCSQRCGPCAPWPGRLRLTRVPIWKPVAAPCSRH
jgi:uncharacterized membrane protein